uniref:PH domain-containing protein n=1 Tax=Panagrolaimus superbus TaxID=310955 RepID=A0A914XX13_9BILA
MFHDFTPTGLSPKRRQKYQAADLYEHLSAAYMGIEECCNAQNRTFNSSHPDAVATLKALDSIFSHRLLNGEKCYWNFVKSFLSMSQQLDLQAEWKTKRNRALSLAWLKDGLNKHTLYFDCTAFSHCKPKILEGYYFKDAFMRNPKLVNQLLEKLDCLMNINFIFHTPVDTTYERVPIAVPSVSNEPEELNTSVPQLHSLRRAKILPASPFVEVPDVDHSELIAGDLPTSQSLIEMTRDLPRVETRDIPLDEELGNFEANHMTKAHHVTASDTVSEKGSENDTNEHMLEETLPEVSAEGHNGDDLVDSTYTVEDEEKAEEPEPEVAPMVDNFSDVHAADPIPGEFILEPYEVIELGLSIFVDQGERYRKSYSVYTDHAIGRPLQRLFVLTDRRVYVLSYKASEMNDAMEATPSPNSLTESRPHAEFRLHAYVHFSDIDCICVGIDYQVFAIECTHKKFSMSYSDHESKNLFVECGSIELTKQLLSSVKQAMIELIGEAPSIFTDGTPSSITLKRFVSRELETTNASILHHSLIYWLEYAGTTSELDALEGYLTFREVKHKNWIKPYGEWKYAYFVLKGCMLYQFVDSTCKFAEQKWNLRDFIETVGEVELRNDEQHVFQLTSYEGSTGFQFSCANMETMRTWIQNINISLSNSNSTPDAVPCSISISSEWILFAHEGANCAVDGFMRLLKKIDISNITSVTSVHTESVNVIVIEHQSNSTDWIVVRTLSELRRLETTFNIKCGLAVTDSVDEMHFGRDKSNILYKQCAKMHDFWRNAPVSD